eukprot:scaffold131655_cov57-Phaeocystis_antarctica.AAC.2
MRHLRALGGVGVGGDRTVLRVVGGRGLELAQRGVGIGIGLGSAAAHGGRAGVAAAAVGLTPRVGRGGHQRSARELGLGRRGQSDARGEGGRRVGVVVVLAVGASTRPRRAQAGGAVGDAPGVEVGVAADAGAARARVAGQHGHLAELGRDTHGCAPPRDLGLDLRDLRVDLRVGGRLRYDLAHLAEQAVVLTAACLLRQVRAPRLGLPAQQRGGLGLGCGLVALVRPVGGGAPRRLGEGRLLGRRGVRLGLRLLRLLGEVGRGLDAGRGRRRRRLLRRSLLREVGRRLDAGRSGRGLGLCEVGRAPRLRLPGRLLAARRLEQSVGRALGAAVVAHERRRSGLRLVRPVARGAPGHLVEVSGLLGFQLRGGGRCPDALDRRAALGHRTALGRRTALAARARGGNLLCPLEVGGRALAGGRGVGRHLLHGIGLVVLITQRRVVQVRGRRLDDVELGRGRTGGRGGRGALPRRHAELEVPLPRLQAAVLRLCDVVGDHGLQHAHVEGLLLLLLLVPRGEGPEARLLRLLLALGLLRPLDLLDRLLLLDLRGDLARGLAAALQPLGGKLLAPRREDVGLDRVLEAQHLVLILLDLRHLGLRLDRLGRLVALHGRLRRHRALLRHRHRVLLVVHARGRGRRLGLQ